MPTVYRFTVKTDAYETRYMKSPGFSFEVRRASAAALRDAYAQACRLLATNAPASSYATAWLEISDRFGPRTLAKFVPVLGRNGSRSAWLLNEWCEELSSDAFEARVECGPQRANNS